MRGVKYLIIKNALYGLKEDVKRYLESKDSLINKLENHQGVTSYDDLQDLKIIDLTIPL